MPTNTTAGTYTRSEQMMTNERLEKEQVIDAAKQLAQNPSDKAVEAVGNAIVELAVGRMERQREMQNNGKKLDIGFADATVQREASSRAVARHKGE